MERYKKEQIVEGHVLCTPVVKVHTDLTVFTYSAVDIMCALLVICWRILQEKTLF